MPLKKLLICVDNCLISMEGGTAKQQNLAYNAVRYAKKKLMHRYRTLHIKVKLGRLYSGDDGSCEWLETNIRPREFKLFVTNRNKKAMLLTIFHEMVHVKQFASGDLKQRYKPGHVHLWKNKKYFIKETAYEDWPWEKEADELEIQLYEGFVEM